MSKKILILLLIIVISILFSSTSVLALQQAEIEPDHTSIAMGVQTLNGDLLALNLHGEMGFSPNFGVGGLLTYYEEKDSDDSKKILDLHGKLAIVKERDLDVSAMAGMHTSLNEDSTNYPKIGVLVSKSETQNLDLNFGIEFLLKADHNVVGYTLGGDYKLTDDVHIEIEHRRFAGQDESEGLNIGFRTYFK